MFPLVCVIGTLLFSLDIKNQAQEVKSAFEEDKILTETLFGNFECADELTSQYAQYTY